MKKSNLLIVGISIIISSCKAINGDYLIVHSNDKDLYIRHYFHESNDEYARVYGSNIQNDSITFSKDDNDLLVNDFKYSEEQKKRIAVGNMRYVNYYTSITDIKYSENTTELINIVPVNDLDFLKNDNEIVKIIEENCKDANNAADKYFYNGCNFILPKSNSLEYLPNNSKIISLEILKNKKNKFQEMNLKVKYFDAYIDYKRTYYYQDKRIFKIKTLIKDSISSDTVLDSYSKISLK
ncbi:hypothetical protein [[Flexibacter] sp. ATCC 35103]|uniref:hypothetical protein n=1 Tax=[Flexibacter] sp. ATCC 35103 TaxID=1937528 RepID=UPI0009C75648|nr:hypothetical protein [[Flexibacter] sp. ATCC 35103]OMQ11277.1 hypothetical protein BXU01_13230 [[Flexibacter] sp. ATCC 35103]